jgi:glycosyltransferase involved in cell wall biosynthesis
MRICVDIRYNTRSGMSSFIYNFTRHLINSDQKCEYVFLMDRPFEEIDLSQFDTLHVPQGGPLLQMSWIQTILPGLLKRKGATIYHSLKHLGPLYCPAFKTMYTVGAAGQHSGVYPVSFKENLYWKYLQGALLKKADLIVAHSNYIRDCLMDHLRIPAERVVTIYNGRDEYFQPLQDRKPIEVCLEKLEITQPFLLCVGNVVPVKNYKTVLCAYKQLVERTKMEAKLIIAGGTGDRHFHDLKKLVREWNLEESVKFIGQVGKADLRCLYNAAEMLIHPSLHEGFCAAIVEAMACGLPVVCSSTTSLPEVVGDAAMLYSDPENAEELASRMESVITSKATRDRLSDRALKRASQFSWNRCVNETVGMYAKLSN